MPAPRFSVAIPTHNRLDLLRDAIETVRRQDWQDWELQVFDNASQDDIVGHVTGLGDPRIICVRSDRFLPVTESWNRAIGATTGQYVTLLGDDDGLGPGYFTKLDKLIRDFGDPALIYTNILQFFHPGVAPWERRGYVADIRNAFFFRQRQEPFLLSRQEAAEAVIGSVTLRRNFTFNMQAFSFSRGFLGDLARDGPVFRSPFPDYYLANVAIGRSPSTLVVPQAMAIAGVSKASFGFALFNGQEQRGHQVLNSKIETDPLYDDVRKFLLPGSQYQTSYLLTMAHVVRALRDRNDLQIGFGRYRRLQMLIVIESIQSWKWWRKKAGRELWRLLSPIERGEAIILSLLLRATRRWAPRMNGLIQRHIRESRFTPDISYLNRGDFSDILQVYGWIEQGGGRGSAAS